MNILFLRGFNNYFNRIVKKYSTLQDYKDNSTSNLVFTNINFNPNDGVATELIIGSPDQKEAGSALDWENIGTPDYCICYEGDPVVIRSRWFVLESERTRKGQYRLALKRDVLAEHFDRVMEAPCFVEKGFVNNVDSPFLYNKENMTYNQIKQSETLLKDNTGCGWIVGYVSQDGNRYPAQDANPNYYKSQARAGSLPSDYDWDDLPAGLKTIIDSGQPRSIAEFSDFEFECSLGYPGETQYTATYLLSHRYRPDNTIVISNRYKGENKGYFVQTNYNAFEPEGISYNSSGLYATNDSGLRWFIDNLVGKIFPRKSSPFATYYETTVGRDFISKQSFNTYKSVYNNKVVSRNGRIYRIKIEDERVNTSDSEKVEVKYSDCTDSNKKWLELVSGGLLQNFTVAEKASQFLKDTSYGPATSFEYVVTRGYQASMPKYKIDSVLGTDPILGANTVIFTVKKKSYKLATLTLVPEETMEIRGYIPDTRQQCVDGNIDIFAIPYSDNFEFTYQNVAHQVTSKDIAIQASTLLGQAGDNVYDIQLLPYFPDQRLVGSKSGDEATGFIYQESVDLDEFLVNVDYSLIVDSSDTHTPIIPVFWSRVSKGTFNINKVITSSASFEAGTPLGRKLANETEIFRIVSPNYAGQFEFSLAKSGTEVSYFNIDFNYKPINPYIHVTPALSGLYGGSFVDLNDIRGLVCGGDYSITRIVDSWKQYQLQNKNYQEIFDRQISNIDVNNQIAREQQEFAGIAGIITGGVGGAAGGALTGAKLGGGAGAIAGAAIGAVGGTVMGGIGYAKDKEWLLRQQQEARSYAIDQFGYQLGNIQALPRSLAKTSTLTENNKVFPFVENYQATQEEVNNLTNKIKFNGMTVMTLAKLEDYSTSSFDKTFVKGQMVRLEDIDDDFHIVDAIYQEVNKGFYIPQVKQGE